MKSVFGPPNVLLNSSSPSGSATRSHPSNPAPNEELFNKTFGGPNTDFILSLALDSQENIILVGVTASFGSGGDDVWIVKFDKSGNELWNRTFGGVGDDRGERVIVDEDDNIVVCGSISGRSDGLLLKIDREGTFLFNRTFGGSESDYCGGLTRDVAGNFVVSATTFSFGNGLGDFWVLTFDQNGNELANRTYGGPEDDRNADLAIDSQQNMLLLGSTKSEGAGDFDFWLIKLDQNGDLVYNRTYGGERSDFAVDLALDRRNNILMAGTPRFSIGTGGTEQNVAWLLKVPSQVTDFQITHSQGQLTLMDTLRGTETVGGETWTCEVTASDGLENVTAFSNSLTVQPVVFINSPANGTTINVSSLAVPFNISFALPVDAVFLIKGGRGKFALHFLYFSACEHFSSYLRHAHGDYYRDRSREHRPEQHYDNSCAGH